MSTLLRYRLTWTGATGLPGVSTFYSRQDANIPDINPGLKAFFDAIKAYLVTGVTIAYPTSVDAINEVTGKIVGTGSAASQASTVGTGGTAYAAPSGFQVRWVTAGIVNGHKVAGRTYFVPGAGSALSGTGILASAAKTAISTAANTMLGTAGFGMVIWARPYAGGSAGPARAGSSYAATSYVVPDKLVVLRSRRD